jgi:hypothetical protein
MSGTSQLKAAVKFTHFNSLVLQVNVCVTHRNINVCVTHRNINVCVTHRNINVCVTHRNINVTSKLSKNDYSTTF